MANSFLNGKKLNIFFRSFRKKRRRCDQHTTISNPSEFQHVDLPLRVMMMIAFITMKSSSIPLIEGDDALTSNILDLGSSVVCVNIFCFSFAKEKIC